MRTTPQAPRDYTLDYDEVVALDDPEGRDRPGGDDEPRDVRP